jgi:phosphate starvation-inducible membrane PsiE
MRTRLKLRLESEGMKIKKSIVGGILNIASGVLLILVGLIILMAEWEEVPLLGLAFALVYFLIGGILPIAGGIFALKRKRWELALAGSVGAIIGFIFCGVPALILIAMSKNEFE